MKRCTGCGQTKLLTDFYRDPRPGRPERHPRCKACVAEQNRRWQDSNPERVRELKRQQMARYRARYPERVRERERERSRANPAKARAAILKHNFGITPDDYDELLRVQGDVCAICGGDREKNGSRQRRLGVDHDHATGRIRGVLCNPCNNLLAWANDDVGRLRRAVAYLDAPPAPERIAALAVRNTLRRASADRHGGSRAS